MSFDRQALTKDSESSISQGSMNASATIISNGNTVVNSQPISTAIQSFFNNRRAQPSARKASWIELSREAAEHNVGQIRNQIPVGCGLAVVLKGNAYGHGLVPMFKLLQDLADCFVVFTADEAMLLRKTEIEIGITQKRILIMGPVTKEELFLCAQSNIEMVLDSEWAEYLTELKDKKLRVLTHIHLDTGMNREGFQVSNLEAHLAFIKDFPAWSDVLSIKGVMSHLIDPFDEDPRKLWLTSDECKERKDITTVQITKFDEGTDKLKSMLNLNEIPRHICASLSILANPIGRYTYDMVRIGLMVYGLWSRGESMNPWRVLKPVLKWKCKSIAIKVLPKDADIGYGAKVQTKRVSVVGVFPVGYSDGLRTPDEEKAELLSALVNGQHCNVLGVMMNHTEIDLTELNLPLDLLKQPPVEAEFTVAKSNDTVYQDYTKIASHLLRNIIPYEKHTPSPRPFQ
jgi:alanine racemase